MNQETEKLFYLATGPLAALLLGVALMPLRGLTPASNFTFAFLALTIAVAELGGRWAGTATALVSALSLDFFLTQPYLRLAIADKRDVIAFFGLAGCGLLAASFSSRRAEREATRRQLELLHASVDQLESRGPLGPRLSAVLDAARRTLPVLALIARDADGRAVAQSGDPPRPVPMPPVKPDVLLSVESALTLRTSPAFPAEGARLALLAGGRTAGWLDVWGNTTPADPEARRALSAVARVLAALLAGSEPADRA
jgi:hypothetical protein